ncbi:MAG: glycosyltransferase family 4 protein [Gemmataceae bacterium]|nr:glycosyltransferase family 4 protein [Gemmataceae bacterium]
MKVLMVNWPGAPRFRGGDLTQMRKTAEALRPFGVEVAESFDPEPDAAGYDLAHVFNLRTVHVTPGQIVHLKKQGIPIVLSPIYLNPSLALWALQVIPTLFRKVSAPEDIDRLLEDLRNHTLKAKLPGGIVSSADSQNRSRPDYDQLQQAALRLVDHLLPNSLLEIHALMRTLRVCHLPFTVVPYAADPLTFLDPDPTPFVRKFGVRDFVLQVGRIEASKNQLLTVLALRDSGLPLVLIGGNLQKHYLQWCRRHGPKHLGIIPHLPQDQLRSAYAAARVHVLPSWMETCGMTTMEAALAGCSVVCSIAGYEVEYYRELAYYCDPADVGSIRSAVLAAYQNYQKDAERRVRLKQRILSEYTWQRAAEATFQAYRQVLARK